MIVPVEDLPSPNTLQILMETLKGGAQAVDALRSRLGMKRLETLAKKLRSARLAITNPYLFRWLKWKYKRQPVLRRLGHVYPVACFPAPESQWDNPDSVLGTLTRAPAASDQFFPSLDPEYRQTISELDLLLISPERDTPQFTFGSLRTGRRLTMHCSIGTYFQSLDTCESLEWEIRTKAGALVGGTPSHFERFDRLLPLRGKLHEATPQPVRSGAYRVAAVGVSTLIAFHNGHEYRLLLRKRSKRGVPLRPGQFHVIPAAMFGPTTIAIEDEFSVRHNVYREYLEELFSGPELESGQSHRTIFNDPRLQLLEDCLRSGAAQLLLTGVAVNLLNLRPEICTLLVFHDSNWFKRVTLQINEEYIQTTEHLEEVLSRPEECYDSVPLLEDRQLIAAGRLLPSRMVPAGAAAVWLGVDVLRELIRRTKQGHA